MGSLSHCMKKYGLGANTEAMLRARVDTLKTDGYTHSEATLAASQDFADELETQRLDILAQMSADKNKPDAFVPQANPDDPRLLVSKAAHDYGKVTPGQQQALERTGLIVKGEKLVDRYKRITANIKLKMEQGIVDQFAALKDLDMKAYIYARLSKGSDGALEAMMLYGNLKLIDGVTDSDARGIGIIEQFRKLEGEHHRFMAWVAAHRAEQLTAEGRERLFGTQDIAELKSLANGNLRDEANGRPRLAAYMEALAAYNAASRNVLDIAEQSGIIDPESRSMWEKEFYVPFYRAMEDEKSGPAIARNSGLVRQYAFKKLKGGAGKLHNDLLANVMMNWSHLLSAAAKNRAAAQALTAAENIGVASQYPAGQAAPKGSVFYLDKGKQVWYDVHDPYTLAAITSLEAGLVGGAAGKALSQIKSALTIGVTASPLFKVRNLIRDSLAVIAQSDISLNVPGNVLVGANAMRNKKGQTYASMLAGGGLIRFGAMMDGNRSTHVSKLINSGVKVHTILDTKEKVLDFVQVAWDHYNELGDISEGANRAALYKQMRAEGKSHLEASFAARDLMDFSKGGTWGAIRFLTQTVPFMNARIQGLHRLGQGAAAHPLRFAAVLTALSLASVALMLAFEDDDEWKKRTPEDRDNFWWFRLPGSDIAWRIPKPFEVGVLATLAERTVELGRNPAFDSRQFRQRLWYAVNQTLAFNMTPQGVSPIYSIWANKDSYSGRAIRPLGDERLPMREQGSAHATEFGKGVSKTMDATAKAFGKENSTILAPADVDYLVKGYFGWLGAAALTASDAALRPLMDRAEKPASQLKDWTGRMIETLPADQSRYVSQFYEQAKIIQESYALYQRQVANGDREGALATKAEYGAAIQAEPRTAAFEKQMSEIRSAMRKVEANRDLDADAKRTKLNLLNSRMNTIAEKATRLTNVAVQ